jgi:phosphonate transport system substrate-binding protein
MKDHAPKPDLETRRRVLRGLAGAVTTGMAGALPAFAQSAKPVSKAYRLAVVPQFTPLEMTHFWAPVVQALSQAGLPCELVVYPTIASFEPEFLKGQADIVYLNPYHMVMAKRAHGYEALLRDTRPLEGLLLVKHDGPVKSMEQLKDHKIAFPAPNAFAASLYIRSVLERQYRLRFEASYAGTHRNAVRQVLSGDAAAAGVVKTTFEREPPEVQQAFRTIYTTPALSSHPLAVHPRVPQAVRKLLIEILQATARNLETKPLMASIQMPNPVSANYAMDYAPLERLKIEKFVITE